MTQVATAGWPNRLLDLDDWQALGVDESHHVECSEGVLVVTPKPFPRHQWVMVGLAQALNLQLPEALAAVADVDVLLARSPLTVRAPDVLVTTRAALAANPPRFDAGDVRLVVEILSEGSRRTDQVTKRSEYAEAGIGEYWILDPGSTITLTCHRLDANGVYQQSGDHRGGTAVQACGVTVRLDLDALGG